MPSRSSNAEPKLRVYWLVALVLVFMFPPEDLVRTRVERGFRLCAFQGAVVFAYEDM